MNQQNAQAVIADLRANLSIESLAERPSGAIAMVLEALKAGLRFSKVIASAYLKELQVSRTIIFLYDSTQFIIVSASGGRH